MEPITRTTDTRATSNLLELIKLMSKVLNRSGTETPIMNTPSLPDKKCYIIQLSLLE
jgi:hypothetical protein